MNNEWQKITEGCQKSHTHAELPERFFTICSNCLFRGTDESTEIYNCQMLQILKQEYKTRCLSKTGMKGLLSLPDWSPIIQVYFIHSPAKSSCFLLLRFFLLQKFKRFSGGRFLKHRLNPPFIRSVYLSNLQIGKNLHVLKGRTSKE